MESAATLTNYLQRSGLLFSPLKQQNCHLKQQTGWVEEETEVLVPIVSEEKEGVNRGQLRNTEVQVDSRNSFISVIMVHKLLHIAKQKVKTVF